MELDQKIVLEALKNMKSELLTFGILAVMITLNSYYSDVSLSIILINSLYFIITIICYTIVKFNGSRKIQPTKKFDDIIQKKDKWKPRKYEKEQDDIKYLYFEDDENYTIWLEPNNNDPIKIPWAKPGFNEVGGYWDVELKYNSEIIKNLYL
jgi:hypothetical protein